jgi:hypothetical protein
MAAVIKWINSLRAKLQPIGGTITAPVSGGLFLLNDGTSHILLNNGTDRLAQN